MKPFMDRDFLLDTDTAKELFHGTAQNCPIIDYHCHLSPRDIWQDVHYENITQIWLGGDHYKWRLMRCAGVEERLITGDADDYEKFLAWAEVLGKAIGNPLYHWSHLELQRYFGYTGVLNRKTADEVWRMTQKIIQGNEFSARSLIKMSGVKTICTTDDPIDSLIWHEKIAADDSFTTRVLPAWRPDKAMDIEKRTYIEYLEKLQEVTGRTIDSYHNLKMALADRMKWFSAHGCRLSDHGMSHVMYRPATEEQIEQIFKKRLQGDVLTEREVENFKTAFMLFMAQKYTEYGWTMQLHYGVRRDNNPVMFDRVGPDTGFDTIDNHTPANEMAAFLGELERRGCLPKTILYSLNPQDNQVIDTLCGCFQNSTARGRVQHGSAWWFNDHFQGMKDHLTSLANLGYLAGFVGMLTDSRSFLSYTRHEYFRRILCRLIGEWVEDGRFPKDMEVLKEIVYDISYGNAEKYFNFEK